MYSISKKKNNTSFFNRRTKRIKFFIVTCLLLTYNSCYSSKDYNSESQELSIKKNKKEMDYNSTNIVKNSGIHVKDFGAIGDGITDDTAAIQAAILALNKNRTSPTGKDGWGQNTLFFDKGEYLVNKPLILNNTSYVGARFIGSGEYATQITFKNDTDVCFEFNAHINLLFQDMTIYHKPINKDRKTWSNSCFKLKGQGGGRRFTLERVTTVNFDQVITHDDTFNGNNDTNLTIGSTFKDFNTFLYSRNTQAVVNEYLQCSWSGGGDIFDIAGYGHTALRGGNIVVGGTWFKFANVPSKYGPSSNYSLHNVKGEYNTDYKGVVSTKIVEAVGKYINVNMSFYNCGLSSSRKKPNSSEKTIVLGSNSQLIFNQCSFINSSIETIAQSTLSSDYKSFIKFLNCPYPILPKQVTRTDTSNGFGHPVISYNDCRGVSNISLLNSTSSHINTTHVNTLTKQNTSDGRLTVNNKSHTYTLSLYNQNTIIEEAYIAINPNPSTIENTIEVKVYADLNKEKQIDSFTFRSNKKGIVYYINNIKGKIVQEALIFEIINPSGRSTGNITVRTKNI